MNSPKDDFFTAVSKKPGDEVFVLTYSEDGTCGLETDRVAALNFFSGKMTLGTPDIDRMAMFNGTTEKGYRFLLIDHTGAFQGFKNKSYRVFPDIQAVQDGIVKEHERIAAARSDFEKFMETRANALNAISLGLHKA